MCNETVHTALRVAFAFLLAGFLVSLLARILSHYSWKLLALQLNHRSWSTLVKSDARTRLRYQLDETRLEHLAFETVGSSLLTILRIGSATAARIACLLLLRVLPLADAESRRAGWLRVAEDLRGLIEPLETLQLRLDQAALQLQERPLPRWIFPEATLDLLAELLVRLWQAIDRASRRLGLASLSPDQRATQAAAAWTFVPWWDPGRIPEAERAAHPVL